MNDFGLHLRCHLSRTRELTLKHLLDADRLVYTLCALLVACATARAFDIDTLSKECSVERKGRGSRTTLQAQPSLQTFCKGRKSMISVGQGHTCALSPDGSYECIGDDEYGQSNNHKTKWHKNKKDGAKYVQVSAGLNIPAHW